MPDELEAANDAQAKALAVTASRSGRTFRRGVWQLLHHGLGRYFRVIMIDGHYLDTEGPLILAPAHRSNLDAPIVATRTKRMVYALSKRSLFKVAPVAWAIAALGAFPVNRGAADRDALKTAQDLLAQGEAIIVFPEGTRQVGPEIGEVFDGAAFLSARTGAPVIPIGVGGTEAAMPSGKKLPRRSNVIIAVGAPMYPTLSDAGKMSLKARRAFTQELKAQLQELQNEANRQSAVAATASGS